MNAWPTVPLESLCEINIGRTPSRSEREYWGPGYPWLSIGDMNQGRDLIWTKEQITERASQSVMGSMAQPGTVALSFKLSIGKVGIVRKPMYTNEAIAALPIRDQSRLLPEYLLWALRTIDLFEESDDAAMGKTLNKKKLARLKIPAPGLAEQRRIAEVLDRADALREKRRKSIALLDELTQSIFLDMFGNPVANRHGWSVKKFGDILDAIESGRSPKCMDRPASGDQWGVLKLSAVTSCEYIPKENKALPLESVPDGKLEVRVGDLLFTRKNTPELVGACAYVRETQSRLMIPDLIFRFKFLPGAPVEPQYIHGLFTNQSKRSRIQALAGGSASSMSNISKSKLLSLPVELPPVDLQTKYVQRIEQIAAMKQQQSAHLARLDTLFASIQSRAFRGELWQDELKDL